MNDLRSTRETRRISLSATRLERKKCEERPHSFPSAERPVFYRRRDWPRETREILGADIMQGALDTLELILEAVIHLVEVRPPGWLSACSKMAQTRT